MGYVLQQYDQNLKRHIIGCNKVNKIHCKYLDKHLLKGKEQLGNACQKQKSSLHSLSPQITKMTLTLKRYARLNPNQKTYLNDASIMG